MDEAVNPADRDIQIRVVVDLADRADLFEVLDNAAVVALSQYSEHGFADPGAVLRATGISERRLLRPGVTPADLASEVLHRVLSHAQTSLQASDRILICHSHVDPEACNQLARTLQRRLAMPGDVPGNDRHAPPGVVVSGYNFGCSGFVRLLQEAVILLETDHSISRVVLLNVESPEFWHDASDRLFCGLVSAGATAALLDRGETSTECSPGGFPVDVVRADDFCLPIHLRVNPRPLFHMETADVRSFRGELERKSVMRMNAEPVFLGGIELMLENLRSAAAMIDRQPGQRVVVVPHQPSGKLLKALIAAARPEFPGFEFLNHLRFGANTISATIPGILARLDDVLAANGSRPLRQGDHLILLAAGICMSSKADQMSAGFACLRHRSVRPRSAVVAGAGAGPSGSH